MTLLLLLAGAGGPSVPPFVSTIDLTGRKSQSLALSGNRSDAPITLDGNRSSAIALEGDRR